jgi:hypothetical protein
LHVLRQSLRIHPFWNGIPRGLNIYPCSSIVLRLDWGISPTKHRSAELTFRYWNRVLRMPPNSPLRRNFTTWHAHFTDPSVATVRDDWFGATRKVFATYGLLNYFDNLRPVPYSEPSSAFVEIWTDYETDYVRRPACRGRLDHFLPIIATLTAEALGYIRALTDEARCSSFSTTRVITIYKLRMAQYLSAWDSLPHGLNVVRMMTVIRSGYAPSPSSSFTVTYFAISPSSSSIVKIGYGLLALLQSSISG